MRNGKIIIVDDHEAVLKTLRVILSREFRTVICVSNPTLLPALLREEDVDVVLLDMNFGTGKQTGGEGLFWLDRIREQANPPAVVLITAFGDVQLAVASLKKGAADFIVKPWDNDKLIATLVSAWEQHVRARYGVKPAVPDMNTEHPEEANSEILINQLQDFLLRKYAAMYGKPFPIIDREAREKLTALLWSSNFQSLEQCIERAILLYDGPFLDASVFYVEQPESATSSLSLDEMEKQFILAVLKEKNDNLTLTAQQLNISRQTLYNKMRKYKL